VRKNLGTKKQNKIPGRRNAKEERRSSPKRQTKQGRSRKNVTRRADRANIDERIKGHGGGQQGGWSRRSKGSNVQRRGTTSQTGRQVLEGNNGKRLKTGLPGGERRKN